MGFYRGPNIVTDNLKFALDAGSERSYSGTGTTSYNIINKETGTLNNNVSFDSTYGGFFEFDGVDDYIDLGNIYDDLVLPVSISAWVYLEKNEFCPIFTSQDNSPTYNGFQFVVGPITISMEYGDGRGEGIPYFRRSKNVVIPNILNNDHY